MLYLSINDDIMKNYEVVNKDRYKYLKKIINFIFKNELNQLEFNYKTVYKNFYNDYLIEMENLGGFDELEEIEKEFYEMVENLKNDTIDGDMMQLKFYDIGNNSKIVLDDYFLEFYDDCNRFYRMYLYIDKHGKIDLIHETILLGHDY